MGKRAVTSPPRLPGFEYVSLVGSGGYADVFLYEQEHPSRQVAIKVLDTSALPGGSAQASFAAEANLMASVSAHPYIVQVFQTGVASDGRPYLVMEFYSGPNFYERARSERISVAEVLRVGVQLSSAVEAAHRGGVLHRDIKPANVLTSAYRRPGLTDFGIAATHGPNTDIAEGVSIPWSPPEALGEAPADRRSDVYSLAATVYTLLAGRSPFEISGGDNRHLALISRIERNPVPPTGRDDVPPTLERVLAAAMAKDPAHRPATAAEFGRQLQAVESELHYVVTPLELADEGRSARSRAEDEDDESTRAKGVTEVRAQEESNAPPISAVGERPAGDAYVVERRREGLLEEPEISDTVIRSPDVEPVIDELAKPPAIDRKWLVGGGVAAVLAAIVAAAVLLGGGGGDESDEPAIDAAQVNDNLDLEVAAPPSPLQEIDGVDAGDGTFAFTWEDRGEGVRYAVTPDGATSSERVDAPQFIADVECIEVAVIAESGLLSAPTRGCA